MAEADPAELEAIIKPTGFFRAKTRNLLALATGWWMSSTAWCPAGWRIW